jgi:hypothetical protein
VDRRRGAGGHDLSEVAERGAAARRARPAPLAGVVVLCALQALLLRLLAAGSNFWTDDFVHFSLIRHGLGRSWAGLRLAVYGHFAPGHRLANYVVFTRTHLDYPLARTFLIVVSVASTLLLYRTLRFWFGNRWVVVLLVVPFALTVVGFDAFLWWANALHTVTSVFATLVCIDGFAHFVVRRRAFYLLQTVAGMCLGLMFYEKPLLVWLYLPGLLLATWPGGLRASVRALLAQWPVWVTLAIPTAVYLWYYKTHGYGGAPEPWTMGQMLRLIWRAWFLGFAPAFFGVSLAGTGTRQAVWGVAAQAVVIALVVVAVRRRRTAWRAWAFFALAFVANVALVGISRVGKYGPVLGSLHRFVVENVFLAILAAAAAFLVPVVRPRGVAETVVVPEPVARQRPRWVRPALAVGVAAALVAYGGAVAADAATVHDTWTGRQVTAWVRHVRSSVAALRARGETFSVWDTTVPDYVMRARYYPRTTVSEFLELGYLPGLRYDDVTVPTYAVDDSGYLVPAPFRVEAPGSLRAPVCSDTSGVLVVPLGAPLRVQQHFVRLSYRSVTAAPVQVRAIANGRYEWASYYRDVGSLRPGRGTFVQHVRPMSGITALRLAVPAAAHLCVDAVDAGYPDADVCRLMARRPGQETQADLVCRHRECWLRGAPSEGPTGTARNGRPCLTATGARLRKPEPHPEPS